MVVPGLAGGLVLDLVLGILGGIECRQTVHGVLILSLDGVAVEILHFRNGVVGAVDGDGSGLALENAAVPDQKGGNQNHGDHADDRIGDPVTAGGLLLLPELLCTLAEHLAGFALAGLFFSGCTHSWFIPLMRKIICFA